MNILFDVGGTRIRVATTLDNKSFGEPVIVSTPQDFDEGMEVLTSAIRTASHNGPIENIIGGLPGTLASNRGELEIAPNLPHWAHGSIKDKLREEFGAEVFLENDTALVALGEAVFGAGQGFSVVGYFTLSTGMGGARISGGKIDDTAHSFEPGKMILETHGAHKTLEELTSGNGFLAQYGVPPKEVQGMEPWLEAARMAARGVHTAVLFWSPDVMILGGPMILGTPAIPYDEVEKETRFLLKEREGHLVMRKAALDSLGGLWGGVAFLQYKLGQNSPT